MASYLNLRFDAPMQSWGGVAVDPRRPSDAFPRASAVAGLVANALGWRHRDADRTTALQDALDYAVREDREPDRIWDFQTADLSQLSGWTPWGPESPGGGSSEGTHILHKEYLANAIFSVALGLLDGSPVGLDEVQQALARPARPVFFGRKSCLPAGPILIGRVEAPSARAALRSVPLPEGTPLQEEGVRIWIDAEVDPAAGYTREVWDRRNYRTGRFDRMRRVVEVRSSMVAEEADDD